MMMHGNNMAFSIQLLALGIGAALVIWGARNQGRGVFLANLFGYFIVIATIIAMLCNGYTSYMRAKYFKEFRMHRMQDQQMMQKDGAADTKDKE